MGLVQSKAKNTDSTVEVDGLFFTIEQNLKKMIPLYGNLIVDFKEAFWGESFSVSFSRGGSC